MYILGFSFGNHDSSVSVVANNEILGIYSEERFSRVKHDSSFPKLALEFAKQKYNLNSENISGACYYEDPVLKANRIRTQFDDRIAFAQYLTKKYKHDDLISPIETISQALSIHLSLIKYANHHECHLYNALATVSKVQNESIKCVILDGVGEFESSSAWNITFQDGFTITNKISSTSFPNSLGLFYSAITAYLGFQVNDAEFKVMGLAAYGDPIYVEEFKELIYIDPKGDIVLDNNYFDFNYNAPFPYKPRFIARFGLPAPESTSYAEEFTTREAVSKNDDLARFANIACSAQALLTSIVTEYILRVNRSDAHRTILFSGGVALNTKCNFSAAKSNRIYISPDPGDGGSSLGAACRLNFEYNKKIPTLPNPYLGLEIIEHSIYSALDQFDSIQHTPNLNEPNLLAQAVNLLSADKVIGWVQGRAEFGPRALGNRSILANPSKKEAQLFVNKSVKFREPFRPFAPAVLAEHIDELFVTEGIDYEFTNSPFRFMLVTLPVKPRAYDLIPACIHVDGTSRVQIVTKQSNPLFYSLLHMFKQKTGVPALLNTSFNLRGEPIVNSAYDALSTFDRSNIDALFINNHSFTKNTET